MGEELQNLIDRIQKEGVDKAQAQTEEIISKARAQASDLAKASEEKAQAILEKAESDTQVYTERAVKTLEQAARDVLIAVGHGVENLFKSLITQSLEESLTPEELMKMIVTMVKAYAERGMTEGRVDILVSPDDQEKLKKLYMAKYRDVLGAGVEIHSDDEIIKGFRISLKDGKVYHDFTVGTIAEVLSSFIQPQIAEIVHRVAEDQVKKK